MISLRFKPRWSAIEARLPLAGIFLQLAREMLTKPDVQVLGTRSLKRWLQAGPEFSRVPFLRNPQRPWITRGNMNNDLFDRLLRALKEGA